MKSYFNGTIINFLILLIILPNFIKSGIIHYNSNEIVGLYDDTDDVIVLNYNNFKYNTFNKNYSSLLEFYNSFCGHCRRFAPKYKQLASEILNWSNIIKVMAIDCADDQNNDVCREFEVMSYPTLRYFSPNFNNTNINNEKNNEQITPSDINNNNNNDSNLGEPIKTQDINMIKDLLIKLIEKESIPANNKFWPNFLSYNEENLNNFFQFTSYYNYKYGILLYDVENSTSASNITLNFNLYDEILIRRTNSNKIAKKFAIDLSTSQAILLFFERSQNSKEIHMERITANQYSDLNDKLNEFLIKKNILPNLNYSKQFNSDMKKFELNLKTRNKLMKNEIIIQIKHDKHKIYQADLECALEYTIFHEIIKYAEINGERLLALQSYINVLTTYNPLGENGKKFLHDVNNYIMEHNQEIRGDKLKAELKKIELKHQPIFSSSRWIGCINTKDGLRGFTCGLWQLFHFMTIQAAENENSSDPLEVLKAMHAYVKYFFGCTDCSNHFQEMAKRRKIWATSNKDDAILFLWAAHNEVNNRLSGDATEDPEFPKIQYPSKYSCPECYRSEQKKIDNDTDWNKQNILEFLKRTYSLQNISRYGVDDETILPATFDKYIQKRGLGTVFSEIDLRMGILLYGFCILMMIVAVKLFLHRGYRKKSYSPNNSVLGKI